MRTSRWLARFSRSVHPTEPGLAQPFTPFGCEQNPSSNIDPALKFPVAWAALLSERPCLTALVLGLFLTLAGISLPFLRFDSDINRVFMSNDDLSQAQRAFETTDEPLSTIAVLIESVDTFTTAQLDEIRFAALDLELSEGVRAVLSPFLLRFPPWHPQFAREPVFQANLEGSDIRGRLAEFRELGINLPVLINSSQDRLLLVVNVAIEEQALGAAVDMVDKIVEPLRAGELTVSLTGEDVVTLVTQAGLKVDLLWLNLIGSVLVALAVAVFIRDLRLTIVAILPGIASGVSTLAIAAWLGFPITLLNNVIPLFVFIVCVANGIHFVQHFRVVTGSTPVRVTDTVATVGPATLLTAATTTVAFAAIGLTDNPQLFEFSVLGALGVVASVPVLFAGFILLASLLKPVTSPPNAQLGAVAEAMARFSIRRTRPIILCGVLVTVLSGYGFVTTTPWFPAYESIPRQSGLAEANDRIAKDFGGVFQVWIELPSGADWSTVKRVSEAVEGIALPGAVVSEPVLSRWSGNRDERPDGDVQDILPAHIAERLRDPDTGTARIAVSVAEPMRDNEALALFDELEAAALTAGAVGVIGLPTIMRHSSIRLIEQLTTGLVVACLVATVLISLVYRRPSFLLIILATNLLPILAVGACLHFLAGGQLNPTAVLALTIAFGIAVDDTTHFLNRHALARHAGCSNSAALHQAMQTAGSAVITTTVVLLAGFAATMFSEFFPVRLFGGMLMLSLVAALLADLILLPALLWLGRPRNEQT